MLLSISNHYSSTTLDTPHWYTLLLIISHLYSVLLIVSLQVCTTCFYWVLLSVTDCFSALPTVLIIIIILITTQHYLLIHISGHYSSLLIVIHCYFTDYFTLLPDTQCYSMLLNVTQRHVAYGRFNCRKIEYKNKYF